MKKIYLASSSPRRKELLEKLGVAFEVVPSSYEEDMTQKLSSIDLAKTLAYGKAKDVANKVKEGIIIGADTFIVLNDKKIGKPKSVEDAKQILKELSGQWIENYSGIAIIDVENKQEIVDCELTRIKMKAMTEKEINEYVATGEPLDKAGAFAIQLRGAVFVEKIDGDFSNVMGLPLSNLYRNLLKMGVDIFEK